MGTHLHIMAFLAAAGLSANVAAATHAVTIEAMQFSPATLHVAAGDTVVWTNRDLVAHNATADSGAFHSVDIRPGRSWTFKVTAPGRLPYACTLHPGMKATLIVE